MRQCFARSPIAQQDDERRDQRSLPDRSASRVIRRRTKYAAFEQPAFDLQPTQKAAARFSAVRIEAGECAADGRV
jgi:hypothetical protein